jgi:phenylalanyl-tRNA synthetase alpha chain
MVELRDNEQKTLLALQKLNRRATVAQIMETSGLAHAAVMRAALTLAERKLIAVHEQKQTIITLNQEGKLYAEKELPERGALEMTYRRGGEIPISDIPHEVDITPDAIPVALAWLTQKHWATINREKGTIAVAQEEKPPLGDDERLLKLLAKKGSAIVEKIDKSLQQAAITLKRRKLAKMKEKTLQELELTDVGWQLVKKGLQIVSEISRLTPELIVSGKWRQVRLRKYNIEAPVAITWPGKKHPYARFLDELKEKLVALGFKEMVGPLIELSFFNFDSLYTPQDHPAREIFGVYYVKSPKYGKVDTYKAVVENVKKTHEKGWKTGSTGWRYCFSLRDAQRLLLRAHGTSLSVRTLLSKDLEIPGKYFAVARCYRPDVVDKTHLSEFNQVEGIVVGEDLTLRDLLGVLERFAIDIAGADKVKFRPDYFPFTEPSVELVAYKKDYGWLEFGGSGIFRPEVTLPLGIKVPVLAWGLGVDRLFMMKAGIDDIRYLFAQDLDWIRRKELT